MAEIYLNVYNYVYRYSKTILLHNRRYLGNRYVILLSISGLKHILTKQNETLNSKITIGSKKNVIGTGIKELTKI